MNSFKGIVFAIASSATFGMIALFSIPLIKRGMSIESILFHRFLISSVVMGGVCLFQKESFRFAFKNLGPLLFLAAMYAGTSLLLIHTYEWIPSGIATTIHFLYPVLVSIIMVLIFKEKRSPVLFGTAVASLLGVVMLSWSDRGNMHIYGVLMAVMTIVTYASYIVGVNQTKTGQQMRAEPFTFYILFFSSVFFLIYALAKGGIQPIGSLVDLGNLTSLAVLSTVISDLTLVLAIKYIGSTVTSILGSMEPLVAMFIGVVHFSETFSAYTLLGVTLILAAVSLVVIYSAKSGPRQVVHEYARKKPREEE